jgi:hypothetical protein
MPLEFMLKLDLHDLILEGNRFLYSRGSIPQGYSAQAVDQTLERHREQMIRMLSDAARAKVTGEMLNR